MNNKELIEGAEILRMWRNTWEEIPDYLRVSYPYNWYIINAMEEYAAQFQQKNQSAGVLEIVTALEWLVDEGYRRGSGEVYERCKSALDTYNSGLHAYEKLKENEG